MDVSLETTTPSLRAVHKGEERAEGGLQPTLPRALKELRFLDESWNKGEYGRLKNMLVLYQYFKRLK